MSLKSEVCCPTSCNAKKVTVEDSLERLVRRELRRNMKLEQNKIVITTGDDVSDVVWTQEKLDELQRVVDKIKEQENVRYSFELSDVKVADSQWSQIKNAAQYIKDNIDDPMQS